MKEANQGFANRIDPCVLCAYDTDCDDIADLTSEQGKQECSVSLEDTVCAWAMALAEGDRPASWSVYDRLRCRGVAGILVPSFAPGAEIDDGNLVLWDWVPDRPHKVKVIDPSGRLPKDQLYWR